MNPLQADPDLFTHRPTLALHPSPHQLCYMPSSQNGFSKVDVNRDTLHTTHENGMASVPGQGQSADCPGKEGKEIDMLWSRGAPGS